MAVAKAMPGQYRRVRSYGPPIKLRYPELSWQKAGGSENVLRPVRKQSNRGERTFKVKNSIGPGVNCGQHIHQYDLTIKAAEMCVAA